jgi:hypothetical protein
LHGIGNSTIIVTHKGKLKLLPSINNINTAFYSIEAKENLISLGHLQRQGVIYSNDNENSKERLKIKFNNVTLQNIIISNNNTFLVNKKQLIECKINNMELYNTRNVSYNAFTYNNVHFTNEQRKRMYEAQQLHENQFHIPDIKLKKLIACNKIKTVVTSADIDANTRFRGPCIPCNAGNYKTPSHPTNKLSNPVTKVGEKISFDIHELPVPSPANNTHVIFMVDAKSGYLSVVPALTKKTEDIFKAINHETSTTFNANNHKVQAMHGDAEKVNLSLAPLLGKIGIKLQSSTPGEHAQLVERYIQSTQNTATTIKAGLPYLLPKRLQLPLYKAIAQVRNNQINSRSAPFTPNELVKGKQDNYNHIAFGTTALVVQHQDKRYANAKRNDTVKKEEPKIEIGIIVGHDPTTGQHSTLLENGKIVTRKPHIELPRNVIPFDFKINPSYTNPIKLKQANSNRINNDANIINNNDANLTNNTMTNGNSSKEPLNVQINVANENANEATNVNNYNSQVQLTNTNNDLYINNNINKISEATEATELADNNEELPNNINSITGNTHETLHDIANNINYNPQNHIPNISTNNIDNFIKVNNINGNNNNTNNNANKSNDTISNNNTDTIELGNHLNTASINTKTPTDIRNNIILTSRPKRNIPQTNYRILAGLKMKANVSTNNDKINKKLNSNAIIRKNNNARAQAKIEKYDRIENPSDSKLNNRITHILPIIPPNIHVGEMTISAARKVMPNESIDKAINNELQKQFSDYKSLAPITKENIEKNSKIIRALMFIKQKRDNTVKARLCMNANGQPSNTYNQTYAGTSDTTIRLFILSVYLADAATRGINDQVEMVDFDIPGAFLHNKLTKEHTNGVQLLAKLPKGLPSPYENMLAAILGTIYGLKQSNHIFEQDFIKTLAKHGFIQTRSCPHTFIKFCTINPLNSLTVNDHVDDNFIISTSKTLLAELETLIQQRYGNPKKIIFNYKSTGICGVRLTKHNDYSVTADVGDHIKSFLHRIGMDNVPAALSPSRPDFNEKSNNTIRVNAKEYQMKIGNLVYMLPIRFDIYRQVKELARAMQSPDVFYNNHLFHLLRYLKSCPNMGPRYSADPKDFPNGVELYASADSAFANMWNRQSTGAYTLSIGKNNAPFKVSSNVAPGIQTNPAESEYCNLSICGKEVQRWRYFLEELGHKQTKPTIIEQDNLPAIKLTKAPAISKKSRHIDVSTHHVRNLYNEGIINPIHTDTNIIKADGLTKHFNPTKFLWFRRNLFNIFRFKNISIL